MKAKIAEELTKMGRMLGVVRLAHESNEDYFIRMKKETAIGLKVPISNSEIGTSEGRRNMNDTKQEGELKMKNGEDVRIVILQRGWVMVGFYKREGENCSLTNASVIRTWGTTKGLGEIASAGPTKDTKLDPTNGLVEFHRLTEIATIKCEASVWKAVLK